MAGLRQRLRGAVPALALLGTGVAAAGAPPYSEPLEHSDWEVSEEDATCRIEQTVRHGGALRLRTRPGVVIGAFWQAPAAMSGGAAPRLRSAAPQWLQPTDLEPLDLELEPWGERVFRVPQGFVEPLQTRLVAGHDLRIDFPDAAGSVRFRGVRFARRVPEFRACDEAQAEPPGVDGEALEHWSIRFATASHRLDAAARATLARALEILPRAAGARVRVVGWTDAEGPAAVNAQLSRERARVVRDALIDGGVPAPVVEWRAPGVDPGAEAARAASRRTDIWWLDAARTRGARGRPPAAAAEGKTPHTRPLMTDPDTPGRE